jgi:hypothetical protein
MNKIILVLLFSTLKLKSNVKLSLRIRASITFVFKCDRGACVILNIEFKNEDDWVSLSIRHLQQINIERNPF